MNGSGQGLNWDRIGTAGNGKMVEILQDFESAMSGAERLSPAVLIGPGVTTVLAGLFIWLGGLGWKNVLVGFVGGLSGGVFGYFVIGSQPLPTALSASAAVIIALTFERVFITVIAGILAAGLGLAFLAGPYVQSALAINPRLRYSGTPEPSRAQTVDVGRSLEILGAYAGDAGETMRQACSQMPAGKWVIVAGLGLIAIAGGFTLWRPTSALCFSALGTVLIFAGMYLLLFYKGAGPAGLIGRRATAYASVFAAMVTFGTLEQLILCRQPKRQPTGGKESGKETGKGDENHSTGVAGSM